MNKKRGALLMDLVVSASLLTVVAYLVLTLLPGGALTLHEARQRAHALEMARGALEQLRAEPLTSLAPGTLRELPSRSWDGVVFHPAVSFSTVTGETADQIVAARCSVTWKDAVGEHAVEFGSYYIATP